MSNDNPLRKGDIGGFISRNNVTLMFILLCVAAYFVSGVGLDFLFPELFTRIGRNTFMVLSLIIPVVAGIGLNFGIVIGAIAAQISIFLVVLWGFTGLTGFLLCVLISTPLAMFFGFLVGKLFNSMKGTEMIGGLVAGFFSDGLYQFMFLFVLGGIIKIQSPLMISTGVGVKNTIDLKGNLKYSLDNIPMIFVIDIAFYTVLIMSALMLVYRVVKKQDLKIARTAATVLAAGALYALSYVPAISKFLSTPRLMLLNAVEIGVVIAIIYSLYKIVMKMISKPKDSKTAVPVKEIIYIVCAAGVYGLTYVPQLYKALVAVKLPVMTYLCIIGLCAFIPWFMNTKLGQEMRTVGQSRSVASSAGINVDRTRIIAMIISTVLASYGHLITLQNIGTMATYGSHNQVGLYAIAALLVGGASVHKAGVKQALLGIVLFHTLFILSPIAGQQLMGNAQVGEYFRVFVAYGVIALALAMHAWQGKSGAKRKSISR